MRRPVLVRRHRQGGNALELALTMPVWLTLVAAILDFGWLAYQQTTLDAAVDIGCRDGSVLDPGEDDEGLDEMIAAAEASMISVIESQGGDCSGCTFDIRAEGDYPQRTLVCDVVQPVDGLVGFFLRDYDLAAAHVARLEWQYMPPLL